MAPEPTDHDLDEDGSGEDGAPDAVGGALDVIDRSIGMYVVRRLTGRRTNKPEETAPPVVLSVDQVAYRIGAVAAPQAAAATPADEPKAGPPLVAGTAAVATAAHAATSPPAVGVGPAARTPRPAASAPRERLVRDSGVALLALATIGLVAIVLWPHGPTGQPEPSIFGVNRTVVTPGPTGEVDAATAVATTGPSGESETAVPTSEATSPVVSRTTGAAGQPTPKLPPGATPRPTSRAAPTPTTGATATPSTGATPTPEETATPTPEETATPTPEGTATPTPEETATPTPPEETPSP